MKGIKWIALALVAAALAGFSGLSLARPADDASADVFAGYWVMYAGIWDAAAFDPEDDAAQCLLVYQKGDQEDTYREIQVGSAFDEVNQAINITDGGEEYALTATLYLIEGETEAAAEAAAAAATSDMALWLEDDPVESLRGALEGESGQTVTAYLSQEALDAYGAALREVAAEAGCTLTLATESPRELRFVAVYQRADGSLYAEEYGDTFSGILDGMGFSGSETQSVTVNGETRSETVSVSVTIRVVPALASVRLIEMSAENEPLRAAEITKADEAYDAGADCAYLVVEETSADGSVARTLYDRAGGDVTHARHYPRADGMTETASLAIRFQ